MVQAPVNYAIGGGTNIDALLSGLGGGLGLGNQFAQIQQNQLAAQQAQDLALAKAEEEKAKAARLAEIRAKIAQKSFNAADLAEYGELTSPESMKEVRGAIDSMDEAEQNGYLSSLLRPWAAMASGDYELAKNELNTVIEGYKTTGDVEALGFLSGIAKRIDEDPEDAFESLSMFLPAFPKGKEAVDNYRSQQDQKNKDFAAPLDLEGKRLDNLKKQQDMELAKATAEWKKINATDLSQDQKINLETQMRKNLETLPSVLGFQKKTNQYASILNAGNDASYADPGLKVAGVEPPPQGIADMNLIYSYIKMLDDGGAVMNGDYVAAEGASGAVQQAANLLNKLTKGDKLTPEVRKQYLDEAKGIYEASKALAQKASETYTGIAKRSGLDPANVAVLNFDTPVRNASAKGTIPAGSGGTPPATTPPGGTPAAKPAPKAAEKPKGFTVTAGGKSYSFPDQATADAFAKKVGGVVVAK